jgi:hypothetical protein
VGAESVLLSLELLVVALLVDVLVVVLLEIASLGLLGKIIKQELGHFLMLLQLLLKQLHLHSVT